MGNNKFSAPIAVTVVLFSHYTYMFYVVIFANKGPICLRCFLSCTCSYHIFNAFELVNDWWRQWHTYTYKYTDTSLYSLHKCWLSTPASAMAVGPKSYVTFSNRESIFLRYLCLKHVAYYSCERYSKTLDNMDPRFERDLVPDHFWYFRKAFILRIVNIVYISRISGVRTIMGGYVATFWIKVLTVPS